MNFLTFVLICIIVLQSRIICPEIKLFLWTIRSQSSFLSKKILLFSSIDETKFLAAVIVERFYNNILVIFSGSMKGVAEAPLLSRARKWWRLTTTAIGWGPGNGWRRAGATHLARKQVHIGFAPMLHAHYKLIITDH